LALRRADGGDPGPSSLKPLISPAANRGSEGISIIRALIGSPDLVLLRFSHLISNANQATWLSGDMLKESPPNAETGFGDD
jgi:hypothetical protein